MCVYKNILKPIFFRMDPEDAHNRVLKLGGFLGKYKLTRFLIGALYRYRNKKLNLTVKGRLFENPIGLAAGFDKNAMLTDIMPYVGFGFQEIGSVTAKQCVGNPRPRLFRLPKDRGLAVYYGLCNEGSVAIKERLQNKKFKIPLFISIAKTNDPKINGDESVADYCESYNRLKSLSDFIVINISCPNTGDGRSFEDPALLGKLLKKLNIKNKHVFMKISPDLTYKQIDRVIFLARKYSVEGLVIANLTHDRSKLKTDPKRLSTIKGAISGPVNYNRANELIRHVYEYTNGELLVIGLGGVSSAEDAYAMIKNGATLVQLITGMIYQGPGVIKKINKGLVKLMERDGYNSIKEVVGVNAGKKA